MDKYNFFKKLYRKTHSRKMRHNEHLWPFIKIKRNNIGQIISLKAFNHKVNLISLDEVFKDVNDSIHIVLSGPSINKIDYAKLSHLKIMGVNGSIMLQDKYPNLEFSLYCIIDGTFVEGRVEIVKKIVSKPLKLIATPEVVRYIYQLIPISLIKCKFFIFENISERAYEARLQNIANIKSDPQAFIFSEELFLGCSFNPNLGWFDADTVAFAAFQAALWSKVKNIYFHGLDIKGSTGNPRFYEKKQDSFPKTWLEKSFDNYIQPSFVNSIKLANSNNINIYNLSDNTAFNYDQFPFYDWHKLIQ